MYTIGEFSRIGHVTKKMLRHYDSIGLIVPDEINDQNGYRYYSHAQAIKMMRINKLKEYKFSLKEIIEIFEEDSEEAYFTAIQNKINLVTSEMQSLLSVLTQMQNEVKEMQGGKSMFTKREFTISEDIVEEYNYVSDRKNVGVTEMGPMYEKCYNIIYSEGLTQIGPTYTMYHDDDFNVECSDIEVCIPVDCEIKGVTKKQDKMRIIKTKFIGPFTEISEGYAALFKYAREKNLSVIQPTYEKYLNSLEDVIDPKDYVTEIYFHVKEK